MKTSAFLAVLLAAGASRSLALKIPVQRRAESGKGVSTSRTGLQISNVKSLLYETTVTIAAQDFIVQVDIGSSDLWISKDAGVEVTDIGPVNLVYGGKGGKVTGNVSFAPFSLGPYNIESQAFINNADAEDLDDLFLPVHCDGILGLGLNSVSLINAHVSLATMDTSRGQTPLSNIFANNLSLPTTVSFLLSRADDQEETAGGLFLIGEEAEGYENVLEAPQVPQFTTPEQLGIWTVWLEGATLNGTSQTFNSVLKDAPKGNVLTALDTGTTLALVPSSLAKALYGNIPGAFIDPSSGQFVVPCFSASNLSFTIADQEFPVHPLDLTRVETFVGNDGTNVTTCLGTYVPDDATPESFQNTGKEVTLGDAFMRNAYFSFNYGNDSLIFLENGTLKEVVSKEPFVQLLKLTDQDQAWAEFFEVRQKTMEALPPEPSLDKICQLLSNDPSICNSTNDSDNKSGGDSQNITIQGGASSDDSDSSMSQLLEKVDKYSSIVIGLLVGNVIIGILLCAIALAACIRRGASKSRVSSMYAPVRFKDGESGEDAVYPSKYSD